MITDKSTPQFPSDANQLKVGDWAIYRPKRLVRGLVEEPSVVQIKKIYSGGLARVEVKKTKQIRNIRLTSLEKTDAP